MRWKQSYTRVADPVSRVMVHPLPPEEINPPPRGLLQQYLSAVTGKPRTIPDSDVDHELLEGLLGSSSAARQAAFHWTKYHLAVRLKQGHYSLVSPEVAIGAWAIPPYYADLLSLHDVLGARKIPHAFACITASQEADYVADKPILVLPLAMERRLTKLDAVGYDFAKDDDTRIVRLEALGRTYDIPALKPGPAAVVFASFGLPRATKVARDLASAKPLDERLVMQLNHFGLRTNKKLFRSSDPEIRLPQPLEKQRRAYANSLLTEGADA